MSIVYTFRQTTPPLTWTINHNLGCKPACDVVVNHEGGISKLLPYSVKHLDDNTLMVEFSAMRSGNVRLIGVSGPVTQPAAPSSWTQTGDYWTLNGETAIAPQAWVEYGDTLHGQALPAGYYTDVTLDIGYYNDGVGILGVADGYGGIVYSSTTIKYVGWYWSALALREGGFPIPGHPGAPSYLTGPQRYRIASKTGGVIVMSKVSAGGGVLEGTPLEMTMTSGYNASNLHVVLLGQQTTGFGYPASSATAWPVLAGSGGL